MNNIVALLVIILSAVIYSCNSEAENKGINAVLAFYGGSVTYSKGVIANTDNKKIQGKYYELKLSGVENKIKQYFKSFELPASNCAYLFYSSLSPDERKKYSFIRVVIEGDKSESKYDYTVSDLSRVEKAVLLANDFSGYMKKGEYDNLVAKGNMLAASKQEWAGAKSLFADVDKKYGSVKEFSVQGFTIYSKEIDGVEREFVRISGVLAREKQNTDFSIIVDPEVNSSNKYIYGFGFQE